MNVAAYPLQQAVPSWRDGLLAQVRVLFARYWPALTFFFLLMLVYAAAPWFGDPIFAQEFFGNGMLGFPGRMAFHLVALFWAISVWSDFPVRERTFLRVLPLSRLNQAVHRSLAGFLLLLAAVLPALLMGSLLCMVFSGGSNYLQGTGFTLAGPLLLVIWLGNAYMFGNLLAYWLRRPEYWALLWIPFGLAGLAGLLQLLGSTVLYEVLGQITGLILTGLGFSGPQRSAGGVEIRMGPGATGWGTAVPDPRLIILLFFALLILLSYASMRQHREVTG